MVDQENITLRTILDTLTAMQQESRKSDARVQSMEKTVVEAIGTLNKISDQLSQVLVTLEKSESGQKRLSDQALDVAGKADLIGQQVERVIELQDQMAKSLKGAVSAGPANHTQE